MACESDKCEKYGMHHEYKNGVEIRKCQFCRRDNQPERSKREDKCSKCDNSIYEFEGVEYCDECLMRCSELYRNIERDK